MDATDPYSATRPLLEAYHEESESHIQDSHTRESQDHETPQIFTIGDGEDLSDLGSPEANPEPENQDKDYCWTTKSWKHEDSYTLRQLHETDGKPPEQAVLASQNEAAEAVDPLQLPELPESGGENSNDGFSEADLEPEGYDRYICTTESWLRRDTGGIEPIYIFGHGTGHRGALKCDLQSLYSLHKKLRINLDLLEKYGEVALCSPRVLTKKTYTTQTDLDTAQSVFAKNHIEITETLRHSDPDLPRCSGAFFQIDSQYRIWRNIFAHSFGMSAGNSSGSTRSDTDRFNQMYEPVFEKIGKNIIILEDHLDDEFVWTKPPPAKPWGAPSSNRGATEIGDSSPIISWGIRSESWGERMATISLTSCEDAEREGPPPGCLSGILASCLPCKWWRGRPNHDVEGGHKDERCFAMILAQCRRIKVFRAGMDYLEWQLLDARYLHDARLLNSAIQSSNWEDLPPATLDQAEYIPLN